MSRPLGLSFTPARMGPPSSTQFDSLIALLMFAREGVVLDHGEPALMDSAEWLQRSGMLAIEAREIQYSDRTFTGKVAELTPNGRSLLALLGGGGS